MKKNPQQHGGILLFAEIVDRLRPGKSFSSSLSSIACVFFYQKDPPALILLPIPFLQVGKVAALEIKFAHVVLGLRKTTNVPKPADRTHTKMV